MSENIPKITADMIINAYCQGYFPMGDPETKEILWYSPNPRGIFPLETYRSKKSLRNIMNRGIFSVDFDCQFLDVVCGCADRKETWITADIIQWYHELFLRGLAHSVEVYQNDQLVGGLYGVSLGGAFFGESMFSRVPNASQVALHYLISHLNESGFVLLDTQFMNDHIRSLGGIEISRKDYLSRLKQALQIRTFF